MPSTSFRALALTSAALFLFALEAGIARSPAQPAAAPPSLGKDVDRLFDRWNSTDLPGCTVGISRDGVQILSRAYGMADLEHSIANRPDTIIEAGSVSKQFTAAAVLLLAQQGKVSLDDPVRKYMPELPDYGQPITIRHLLTHTSGLRDWGMVEDVAGWPRTSRAYTHDHVLDIVRRQRSLNYAPGAAFSYTNTGFNLLAVLVSRVTSRSFADYTRDAIFAPLGMTRTSWRDDYTRIVRDRAIGYTVNGSDVSTNMPFENVHGNGGLLTTVGDLLRWTENAVTGTVGGRPFVDTQHTKGRLASGEEIAYSLGALYVTSWRGVPEVNHSGGTAGYRAWIARYPDQHAAVAVLCNAGDAPAWVLGRDAAALLLDLKSSAPARVDAGTVLDEVRGLYRDTRTHEALAIDLVNGELAVPGLGAVVPVARDAFTTKTGGPRLDVERDAAGRITGVRATVSDEVTHLDRVERWTPTPADLQAFTGTYTSDEAEVDLVVALDAGRLVLRRRPATVLPLDPTYVDGFGSRIGHVRFLRDASRNVTGLSIGRDRVWDLRFAKQAPS
jgi:CubicO group peptidase (beta-lactamase class C family)